jgi:hypothetical protein
MEFAENLALDHKFDKDLGHALKESPNNGGFHYFNTKKVNVIDDDDDEEISGEILTKPDQGRFFVFAINIIVHN